MNRLLLLALFFTATFAQLPGTLPGRGPVNPGEDVKLPNGKSQRDEIVKADYKKNLEDAADLAKLADELKSDLEKTDKNIVSIKSIKQAEEIERLARNIRNRLKRY